MGQCHNFFSCCGKAPKKDISMTGHINCALSPTYEPQRRESGNDSGHSSAESLSPNRDSHVQRCSQSSESSGKFSYKGSVSSPAESDVQNKQHFKCTLQASEDLPVFAEGNDTEGVIHSPETLVQKKRRTSLSSVGNLGTKFFRAKSASVCSRPWSRTVEEDCERQDRPPRRAVSLRLPRSRHRKDIDTKVPTVYVEDEEMVSSRSRRKSSLRQALSLLSLNSLSKELGTSSKTQKPVQKILRHPTRRHTTVRGISGLAIDGRSQLSSRSGQRAQALVYYPTSTSLRATYVMQHSGQMT